MNQQGNRVGLDDLSKFFRLPFGAQNNHFVRLVVGKIHERQMGVVVVGRGQKTQLACFQQPDDMKREWWFDQTGR